MKTYEVNNDKSIIKWKGRDDATANYGTIGIKEGKIFVDHGDMIEGHVKIDVASMQLSGDIEMSREKQEALLNHLKSKSFFHVKKFPEMEYKIDHVVKNSGSESLIKGILVLQGEAYGLNFPAGINVRNGTLEAKGSFRLGAINPVVKENIESDYDGDPIREINLSFELVAEAT